MWWHWLSQCHDVVVEMCFREVVLLSCQLNKEQVILTKTANTKYGLIAEEVPPLRLLQPETLFLQRSSPCAVLWAPQTFWVFNRIWWRFGNVRNVGSIGQSMLEINFQRKKYRKEYADFTLDILYIFAFQRKLQDPTTVSLPKIIWIVLCIYFGTKNRLGKAVLKMVIRK